MNIRKVSFKADEAAFFYVALRKGFGGKGYTVEGYKFVESVMDQLEAGGLEALQNGSVVADPSKVFDIVMKEKEYETILKIVKSTPEWKGGKEIKIIMQVIDLLENIPSEKEEEEKK